MDTIKEKRMFERYDDNSSIIFSETEHENFNNSRTYNCSSGGMFFNSGFELPRGAQVCIKMTNYRSIFYAEVARCTEMDIAGKKCYGIGIKFLDPL